MGAMTVPTARGRFRGFTELILVKHLQRRLTRGNDQVRLLEMLAVAPVLLSGEPPVSGLKDLKQCPSLPLGLRSAVRSAQWGSDIGRWLGLG